MALLIARRLVLMALTMLAMSGIIFLILELDPEGVARKALGQFSTPEQRVAWLATNGYYRAVPVGPSGFAAQKRAEEAGNFVYPVSKTRSVIYNAPEEGSEITPPDSGTALSEMSPEQLEMARQMEPVRISPAPRYARWLGKFVTGEFGESYRFKVPVADILWPRLGNTAILAGLAMFFMIVLSLFIGVMAGVREGSLQDRFFSLIAIITTSIPEFASAVIFVAIFVFWLDWLPGTSTMVGGFSWAQMVMPVSVLVLYSAGYVARITRASMADVMRSAFIRTAILKGLPRGKVIVRHAMRNALITPVTVIMLQLPWMLSGVIVVEYFFAYKGFGSLLWEAVKFDDPFLIEACAMVAVVVVVASQLVADIIYTELNPRIRFQ